MGVGVNYTGFNGKSKQMVSQGTGDLGEIVGRSQQGAMQMLQQMSGIAAGNLGKGGRAEVKLLPGGAVTKGPSGICLRGEEMNPVVFGKRVYGSVNGRKGYHTLDDIDPKVDGPVIGGGSMVPLNLDQAGVPKNEERKPDDKGGWRIPTYRTTIMAKISDDGQCVTIFTVTYESDLLVTEGGRIYGKTKEVVSQTNEIACAGVGGGNGKYGIRVFVGSESEENPAFQKFAFGTEQDLDTWNEKEERFDANYDEDGNLKQFPPVKIANVDACTCPVKES